MNTFDDLEPLIGNTPLLEITFDYKGERRRIFAKAEYYNYSGSIKDRVAFHMLKKAYENGTIKRGDTIAEATSGNTGIAFSAMGRALGNKVVIYMPDWMTKERISLMESFGADVRLVSAEEGGFLGSIEKCEKLGMEEGVFLPRQFSNDDNTETHYLYTGKEIAEQMEKLGRRIDGAVAGVGTGGTVMGIGRRVREVNPKAKIFPLEPANSPTLSTGYRTGKHRIYGISDEFIPDIVKLDKLDDVVSVDDGDSIVMAQMLSRTFGLGVGVSSGANMLGCIAAQNKLGGDANIVTVFADDNKKYLSSDYSKEQTIGDDYMTKDIDLISLRAVR